MHLQQEIRCKKIFMANPFLLRQNDRTRLEEGLQVSEHEGVKGSGCRVQGAGFRVQGSGFRAQGSGCRVLGAGFRVQGSEGCSLGITV